MENCVRFSTRKIASRYPSYFRRRHFRDWREKRAIMHALNYIPRRSRVLDIPSGTGRLTKLLMGKGYHVTSADRSREMLSVAQENFNGYRSTLGVPYPQTRYCQEDLIQGTKFSDKEFDGVVCHRLFHHLVETHTRTLAIRELNRVADGPIIFSFFNSFSLSAGIRSVKNMVKGRESTDRIPISRKTIVAELENEGMEVRKIIPAFRGISPLCMVVAQSKHTGFPTKL